MEEIQPCKPKRIYKKCEHNIVKRYCRLCNSNHFCLHNKEKYTCKECNGSSICIHNKRKANCKECSPHLYCEHNRQKSKCKDCGSINYCKHNKSKYNCLECNGISICIHNKQKARCIICSPHLVCIHNKIKSRCKDCGSKDFCIHGITKQICKDCKGSAICIHNKIKYNCLDCCGSKFCIHNVYKPFCKDCKGSAICIHNNKKYNCLECKGSSLCKNCKLVYKSKKYDGHCLRCFIHLFPDKPVTRNYKTKESSVATFVTENFSNFTWNIDKTIQDGCSRRRPDLICDLGYQVIIVEIDENQHYKYDCSCENKRIMELSQDVGHRPIVFIRFNPDDYIDASNKNITSCWGLTPKTGILKIRDIKQTEWNNRLNTLKQQIEYWCNENNKTNKTIEIIQLFYDEIDNNNK